MSRSSDRSFPRISVVCVLVAVMAVAVPTATASPPPGADNPWLQRRIVPLAHAGGEDEHPQETLYAFAQDRKLGVPVLDMDVQMTADGVPVVMHDSTVDRTTNGTGSIGAMTFDQVHALDAAYWFTTDCAACHDRPDADYPYRGMRSGDRTAPAGSTADDFAVPSLAEVFDRFPDAYYDIELKDDSADVTGLARAVADLIHANGLSNRVVIASFGGAGIDVFRDTAPDVATSATLDEVQDFFLTNKVPERAQILDVPPTYTLGDTVIDVVTPDFVARAHAAGLAVWVWMDSKSQQNRAFYTKLANMGVDGLNVSRPSVLMDLLHGRGDAWDPNAPTPPPTSTAQATTTIPSPMPAAAVAAPMAASPAYTG